MFYLGFVEEGEFSSLLFYYLREKGVHIWEGRPFFISTAHTDEDLEFVIQAFRESIAEMQDAGFLPPSDLSGEKSAPQAGMDSSSQDSQSHRLQRSALVPIQGQDNSVASILLHGSFLLRNRK